MIFQNFKIFDFKTKMRKKSRRQKIVVRIFFNDLDCVSRAIENYLGHSSVISERDIDRVYGGKPEKNQPRLPQN